MLIKGARIHTMTEQGVITGDILVRGDRIAEVGGEINQEDRCILDAHDLVIMPGMIDAFIHEGPETDERLLCDANAAGVTAGLIWPAGEGRCRLITSAGIRESNVHAVFPAQHTDAELHERFIDMAEQGNRIVCEVGEAQECRRVLQAVHSTRVKVMFAHLLGCEELMEAVSMAACPVILGLAGKRSESPWLMAARLEALGVEVAVSCGYPKAKLRHLPLCAALCVRDGMDRERAMQAITRVPAALLGLKNAGRIAPGCVADLAIYDGDPLLLATSHVMTIAGGKIRH